MKPTYFIVMQDGSSIKLFTNREEAEAWIMARPLGETSDWIYPFEITGEDETTENSTFRDNLYIKECE